MCNFRYVRVFCKEIFLNKSPVVDKSFWLAQILKPYPICFQARLMFILFGPTEPDGGKKLISCHIQLFNKHFSKCFYMLNGYFYNNKCKIIILTLKKQKQEGLRLLSLCFLVENIMWSQMAMTSTSVSQDLMELSNAFQMFQSDIRGLWSSDDIISIFDEITGKGYLF